MYSRNNITSSSPVDVTTLIQYCTLFRRLTIMYGLLAILMLFLGIDSIASGTTGKFVRALLALYILQALTYIFSSLCLYTLAKWFNIAHVTKNQVLIALLGVSFAMLLILIRLILELCYLSKFKSSVDDDVYGSNQSLETYIAWTVIQFLLILSFNSIAFRFLYMFYTRLESFQEVARNNPNMVYNDNVNQLNPVVMMSNRPVVTEAYVSNSPFAHQVVQGQVVQGQPVQGQVVQVSGPTITAVPVHVNSFTPHNSNSV